MGSSVTDLDCWPEAQKRLLEGTPAKEIARWLQEDMGECTDIKRASLVRRLYRWMETMPPVKAIPAVIVNEKIEQLAVGLDALREMEKLLLMQIERVNDGHALEKNVGLTVPDVGKEQERAFRELRSYVELLQSLGLEPKAPEKIMVGGMVLHHSTESLRGLAKYSSLNDRDIEMLLNLEHKLNDS